MNHFEQKNTKIKQPKYFCSLCDYKCFYKRDYDKHISTRKHQNAVFLNGKSPKVPSSEFRCEICNKIYKNRNGLWYHKKKCNNENETHIKQDGPSITHETIMKVLEENKELRKILCDQQKQIGELIPKVGNNNNNQFNLNVFLNEQCKDALDWDEFIGSIEVGLNQLHTVMNGSITNGVAQVICQGIDELGVYKRPIHCVDPKRKKICIKTQGEWEHDKEKNNKLLETTGRKLQQKHVLLIQKWQEEHPNWTTSEEETELYINLVSKMMGEVDDSKCINEISKKATIPKANS
tara:strand:+ start:817 stop:1692 length:876 start_codon:yes stop_codon:yes gene_type:complete